MTSPSATRVPLHTAASVNAEIRERTRQNIRHFAQHPAQIGRRLEELDREWDIERTLEANAASIALAGTLLGLTVSKWFLAVPVVVGGFLLQHAVQGWCPPAPVFRRLGYRTPREIEAERYALKALRGDFAEVGMAPRAENAWAATGR